MKTRAGARAQARAMNRNRGAKAVFGFAALLFCLLGSSARVWAQESTGEFSDYTVRQLLAPCTEGDNDSRWGAVAESECEQYIKGFTDALLIFSADSGDICLPEAGNRPDEIRWAFMKWAHRHFQEIDELSAAQGVQATLQASFACDK